MSKDVIVDYDVLAEHPGRITKMIEKIITEIEAAKQEGNELYTITVEQMHECDNKLDELSRQYRQSKTENNDYFDATDTNNSTPHYSDSCEGDFYRGDLRQKYDEVYSKKNELKQCQSVLIALGDKTIRISKTIDDLKEKSEYCNKIFEKTITAILDLKN